MYEKKDESNGFEPEDESQSAHAPEPVVSSGNPPEKDNGEPEITDENADRDFVSDADSLVVEQADNDGTGLKDDGDMDEGGGPDDPESNEKSVEWLIPKSELVKIIEGLLLVSGRSVSISTLNKAVKKAQPKEIREVLGHIMSKYGDPSSGFHLVEVSNGYQFRSDPACAPFIREMMKARPLRLSRAALETLAIVAYRQPVSRAEVEDIRGVDVGGVLRTLLEKKLLRILGKREEPGRPLIYGTSKEFLDTFNLRSLRDLPTLQEFQELSEEHQVKIDSTFPREDQSDEAEEDALFDAREVHADSTRVASELEAAARDLETVVGEADGAIAEVLGRIPYDEQVEPAEEDEAMADIEIIAAPHREGQSDIMEAKKENDADRSAEPDSDSPFSSESRNEEDDSSSSLGEEESE